MLATRFESRFHHLQASWLQHLFLSLSFPIWRVEFRVGGGGAGSMVWFCRGSGPLALPGPTDVQPIRGMLWVPPSRPWALPELQRMMGWEPSEVPPWPHLAGTTVELLGHVWRAG